jgi:hypothetical protein
MADWAWGDFVKGDATLKAKLGVKDKANFMAWIDRQTVWYGRRGLATPNRQGLLMTDIVL